MAVVDAVRKSTDDRESGTAFSAARDVFVFLKDEGYVTATRRTRTASRAATRKPSYLAVTKGPKHEDMLARLFDPLLHISHYVSMLLGYLMLQPLK